MHEREHCFITNWSVFTLSRGTQMTKAMAAMLVFLTNEVN